MAFGKFGARKKTVPVTKKLLVPALTPELLSLIHHTFSLYEISFVRERTSGGEHLSPNNVLQLNSQAHYNYNRIRNCFASYTAGELTIPPHLTIPQHTTHLGARKTCLITILFDLRIPSILPTYD